MPPIHRIDPTTDPHWDDLLQTNPNSSFFHTAAWARVLQASYGYKPLYFSRIENGRLTALLALMQVNSWLTGRRAVSLPFTDACPLLADDAGAFKALFEAARQYGEDQGWKNIEIRGGQSWLKDQPPSERFLVHRLPLHADLERILAGFKSSTRRNIKKAQKEGVAATAEHTPEAVAAFYRLNCLTRRDHGLPPQPKRFFDYLCRYVISQKKGMVMLARLKGRPIAAAVFLRHAGQAVYKYGASDKRFQHLRANNLVMWQAIQHFASEGALTLDMGRTELHHEGLARFKCAWGAHEETQFYYKYDIKRRTFRAAPPGVKSSYAVFNKMPMPLLQLTGRLLYRHMG